MTTQEEQTTESGLQRALAQAERTTFDAVRGEIEERAEALMPDTVVDMRHTHVTPTLGFEIPGLGALDLTSWSQGQLARHLGIRWDRWFEGIDPPDVQHELQRRFQKDDRASSFLVRPQQSPTPTRTGVARAFLSPSYSPVDDRRVVEAMAHTFPPAALDELQFLRHDFTDRSTHLTGFFPEVIDLGGEDHRFGFQLRNSEVGFSAFTLDAFFFRIICSNGLLSIEGKRGLLKQRHISIDASTLRERLRDAWRALLSAKDAGIRRITASRSSGASLVELSNFLRSRNIPKKTIEAVQEKVLKGTNDDELDEVTVFDLVQGVTATARDLEDPNARHELEKLAGEFMLRNT